MERLETLRKELPSPLHTLKKLHQEPEKIHLGWLLAACPARSLIMSYTYSKQATADIDPGS